MYQQLALASESNALVQEIGPSTHFELGSAANLIVRRRQPGLSPQSGDELLMIAAHLDSDYLPTNCPGANDNAVGVAMAVALFEAVNRTGISKVPTELVLYDAEEYDGTGCFTVASDFLDDSDEQMGDVTLIWRQASEQFGNYFVSGEQMSSHQFPIRPDYRNAKLRILEIDGCGKGDTIVAHTRSNRIVEGDLWFKEIYSPISRFHKSDHTLVEVDFNNIAYRFAAMGASIESLILQYSGVDLHLHSYRDTYDTVDLDLAVRATEIYYTLIAESFAKKASA
jgi:hypothetical protein